MLKRLHLDIVIPLLTAIVTTLIWFFGDFLPSDWDSKYAIPLKINIFLIIIFTIILVALIIKVISLQREITSLVAENKELTKFSKVENYDLFQDSKGIFYCMIHKSPVTETGPMGYSKGSYLCTECKFWYENHNTPHKLDIFWN